MSVSVSVMSVRVMSVDVSVMRCSCVLRATGVKSCLEATCPSCHCLCLLAGVAFFPVAPQGLALVGGHRKERKEECQKKCCFMLMQAQQAQAGMSRHLA